MVYKLFVLDRNTWNHATVCALFSLHKNNLYYIIVWKQNNIVPMSKELSAIKILGTFRN